jgi:hypothetical protein
MGSLPATLPFSGYAFAKNANNNDNAKNVFFMYLLVFKVV